MRLLVTGGAGFIGSNFVRYHLREHPEDEIVNLDLLTYAGNLENLIDVENNSNYTFVKGDIADPGAVEKLASGGFDAILNFAAESHVDRSITEPGTFVRTNINGTLVLLNVALKYKVGRFLQISTDEVYGSLGDRGHFTEETPLAPNSPYSASKASADLLVRAYHRTYGLNALITRSSNNYGPYQFPEKLIPLMVTNALDDEKLPVYGKGLNVRDWLYVEDNCRGIDMVLREGRAGEIYNICGGNEKKNIEVVRAVLKLLGKPEALIAFVEDRPGHDWRYAMKSEKMISEFGWKPSVDFEEGLKKTVTWYVENRQWWEKVKSGEYLDYYDRMYGRRIEESKTTGGKK
ncbi:MAG: dTDP-glucose 4,6-dehydratase [Candidatus Glassbacteria bacterium]